MSVLLDAGLVVMILNALVSDRISQSLLLQRTPYRVLYTEYTEDKK